MTAPFTRPKKQRRARPFDEAREAVLAARSEVANLQASKLACAVADAWAMRAQQETIKAMRGSPYWGPLFDALERLEFVTRTSSMRKVRP